MGNDVEIKNVSNDTIKVPIFPDRLSGYLYWCNFVPINTYQEYIAVINQVKFGMGLLKKDSGLYKKAEDALKSAVPNQREETLASADISGKVIEVYRFKASDADNCQCRIEDYKEMLADFRDQQYQNVIKKLRETALQIDEEIDKKIFPDYDPSLDREIDKYIKSELKLGDKNDA